MGEAAAHQNLAATAADQDRKADALSHGEQALRLYQAISHEARQAELLNDVGWFCADLGDYQRARTYCEQSLALIAKLGGCHF